MHCPHLKDLPPSPAGLTGWPWTEQSERLPEAMPGGEPWPRISIVTPSYNQGTYLEKTIRSVLLQGYPDVEYIITDGGSSDGSVESIRKYEPWLAHWESTPDRGQSHALNKGFAKAAGVVFSWLNSDDFLAPDALGAVARARSEHPGCVGWAGISLLLDGEGRERAVRKPKPGSKEELLRWDLEAFMPQPSCFFDAGAFRRAGGVKENLYYTMDAELWARLAEGGRFAAIDRVLSYEVRHPQAKTSTDYRGQLVELMANAVNLGVPKAGRDLLAANLERELSALLASARVVDCMTYRELVVYMFNRAASSLTRRWRGE